MEDTRKGDACLHEMAIRIATVFASLKVNVLTRKKKCVYHRYKRYPFF